MDKCCALLLAAYMCGYSFFNPFLMFLDIPTMPKRRGSIMKCVSNSLCEKIPDRMPLLNFVWLVGFGMDNYFADAFI
jgi:hypothetical protein